MTINNNSKLAILGMLSLRPMTGYEVKKTINYSIGMFWNESYGQIYPTLKKLAADGLAVAKRSKGRGNTDKCFYKPTAKGRQTLKAWLVVPAKTNIIRSEILLKIFFGGQADLSVTRMHIEQELVECQQSLATLAIAETTLARRAVAGQNLADFHSGLTVAYGKKFLVSALEWCEESLRLCAKKERMVKVANLKKRI